MLPSRLLRSALRATLALALVACGSPVPTPDAAASDAATPIDLGGIDGGVDAASLPIDAGADVGRDAATVDVGLDATGGDADGDGFDAVTELACATDPASATSHPDPTVLLGTGTVADPYRICFAEHLALLAALVDVVSANARVGRDLDLTGITLPHIGHAATPYAAVFDGAGHTLSHLTSGSAATAGTPMFESLGTTGVIRDLTVSSAVSFGGSVLVGTNLGLVERVTVDGMVSGVSFMGIVVNDNSGTVTDCVARGSLVGSNHVGGLAGSSHAGVIRRSSSTARVMGMNRVGGLLGSMFAGSVEQCWASGAVSGTGVDQGGLVGSLFTGMVTDSYALGDVTGSTAGGVGGLVGTGPGNLVARVYARGHVTGTTTGAVIGNTMSLSPSACFFDSSTGAADAACVGRTPAEMMLAASFPGFDFTTPIWVIDASIRSSPVLHWE